MYVRPVHELADHAIDAAVAAGAGYAAATRDVDVVLPLGGMIRLVLTAPLAA